MVLVTVVLVASCSSSKPAAAPATTTTNAAATTTTSPPTLPDGCDVGTPDAGAVVTFVAAGRAWAMDPSRPNRFTCLFPVGDSGFFSWGPQGDRVVLAG